MMTAEARHQTLIAQLPPARGRLTAAVPLARFSWFRVGGPAEVLFEPADENDLAAFLATTPRDVPVTVIGLGSNILVRDGGIPGVVVRLGRPFAVVCHEGVDLVAGAGAASLRVAVAARDAKLTGLEFLYGVPGTIGGALRMNAGAYGAEVKDVAVAARALDRRGAAHDLDAGALGFGYRHSAVAGDWIFVSARFRGRAGDSTTITRRMQEIQAERRLSQPLQTPTGGSTFKNPPGARAWELIERAGCRGLRRGGAQISEKHCNFLINNGAATAADLEGLGEEVRRRVLESTGVTLEWEICRLGVASMLAGCDVAKEGAP